MGGLLGHKGSLLNGLVRFYKGTIRVFLGVWGLGVQFLVESLTGFL